jgi:hypothetical protein
MSTAPGKSEEPASKSPFDRAVLARLQTPLAIADAAKRLRDAIKSEFPIRGNRWRPTSRNNLHFDGVPAATAPSVGLVYNALFQLEALLNPEKRTLDPNDPSRRPFTQVHLWPSWIEKEDRPVYRLLWQGDDLPGHLEAILGTTHDISVHYDWHFQLYGNEEHRKIEPRWKWPAVPAVDDLLVDRLGTEAEAIERTCEALASQARSICPAAPGDKSGSQGAGKKRAGGNRPLAKSPNPKRRWRDAVYARIFKEHKHGARYVDTLTAIRKMDGFADFHEQVKEAGLKLDKKLIERAINSHTQRERRKQQAADK